MGKISASSSTTRIHPGPTGKPLAALSAERTRTRRTIRFCFSSSINISNRGTCRISNVTVGVGSGICAYRCPIQPGSKRIPISHTTIDLINDLILFLRSGNQTCVQCLVNNLQDILQRQIIKSSGQSRSLILCLVRNLDLIIITQVLNHLIQRCLHKTKLPCPPSQLVHVFFRHYRYLLVLHRILSRHSSGKYHILLFLPRR